MSNKILIVEDEINVANDYQKLLELNGFEVVGIANTYEFALDLFFENKPDLILCDVHLKSKKNGIDFVKDISKIDETAIIYTTSFCDETTLVKALSTHPKSYLIKPFCNTQLLVAVKRVLNNTNDSQCFKEFGVTPTNRELEVIKLVAEGYTTKEIAKALSICFETVQSHRKNVLHKFNVSSSAELVSIAHSNKWLS